jgi:hypothetical protein
MDFFKDVVVSKGIEVYQARSVPISHPDDKEFSLLQSFQLAVQRIPLEKLSFSC